MREKMICPACGAEMNCHAEKLVYSDIGSAAHIGLAEHIDEVHTCPQCGRTELRAAGNLSKNGMTANCYHQLLSANISDQYLCGGAQT